MVFMLNANYLLVIIGLLFYHLGVTGKRYVLRQDQPTCLPCYEDKFANKCEKCEKAIGTDFKVIS